MHWRDTLRTPKGDQYIGGYREYIGESSLHGRDTMMSVGGIVSTQGDTGLTKVFLQSQWFYQRPSPH